MERTDDGEEYKLGGRGQKRQNDTGKGEDKGEEEHSQEDIEINKHHEQFKNTLLKRVS